MFNSHLRESKKATEQLLNTPLKNSIRLQSDDSNGTPPAKSRFAQYSNESVNKMLKAPAKNNAKGLKIHDGSEQREKHHTRNGSTNISELSNEYESEQSKTVWMFDEESVQKLRLPNRSKKENKSFENCDSILDDQSNHQATDQFQMPAEEHSDVTASLFLFRDDEVDSSQDDSSRSSHYHEQLNMPEVS